MLTSKFSAALCLCPTYLLPTYRRAWFCPTAYWKRRLTDGGSSNKSQVVLCSTSSKATLQGHHVWIELMDLKKYGAAQIVYVIKSILDRDSLIIRVLWNHQTCYGPNVPCLNALHKHVLSCDLGFEWLVIAALKLVSCNFIQSKFWLCWIN